MAALGELLCSRVSEKPTKSWFDSVSRWLTWSLFDFKLCIFRCLPNFDFAFGPHTVRELLTVWKTFHFWFTSFPLLDCFVYYCTLVCAVGWVLIPSFLWWHTIFYNYDILNICWIDWIIQTPFFSSCKKQMSVFLQGTLGFHSKWELHLFSQEWFLYAGALDCYCTGWPYSC